VPTRTWADEELAEAMQHLDQMDDAVFRRLYRLDAAQIRDIRAAFSDWPR
jgi:hypothetical protein